MTAPDNLDQAGLQTFLLQHPQQEINGFLPGVPAGPETTPTPAQIRSAIDKNIASYYLLQRLHRRRGQRVDSGGQ